MHLWVYQFEGRNELACLRISTFHVHPADAYQRVRITPIYKQFIQLFCLIFDANKTEQTLEECDIEASQ